MTTSTETHALAAPKKVKRNSPAKRAAPSAGKKTPPFRMNTRPPGLPLGGDARILRDLLIYYGFPRAVSREVADQFEMIDRAARPSIGGDADKFKQLVDRGVEPYDALDMVVSVNNAMKSAVSRWRARHPDAPSGRKKKIVNYVRATAAAPVSSVACLAPLNGETG